MAKEDIEQEQRRIVEDLVRIDAMIGKLLPDDRDVLMQPMALGKWSLAEHGLHIVLTLEDCAQRFESAGQGQPGSWSQRLALHAILVTFRFPSGRRAQTHLCPNIMLDRTTILSRLRESRDRLVALEKQLRLGTGHMAASHPEFGMISFSKWIRLLLIHAMHHKRLMRNML